MPVVLTFSFLQMEFYIKTNVSGALSLWLVFRATETIRQSQNQIHISDIKMTCPCGNHWQGLKVPIRKSRARATRALNFSLALLFNNTNAAYDRDSAVVPLKMLR